MEILAPAGGKKQLEAAFAAGADAIYLGMKAFSARAGAENFDIEALRELVMSAHLRGIKVYIALNTLLKNSELAGVLNLADDIYMAGADALIIQDLGLLHMIKNRYPGMDLHASTQMTVHSVSGAEFAKEQNIKRVILARELPLDEIADISRSGIDTEVFVHGAICISYSGQCFMSVSNGKRSANRGNCAQPCRLTYKLYRDGKEISEKPILSPKEKSYIDNLNELAEAGVVSLKIEGRLRNEYYVFETVRQYKRALEGKVYSLKPISQIFNRGEFTNLSLYKKPDMSYIGKSQSNCGIYLGKIVSGKIELETDIALGDGVSIEGGGGFIVTKISEEKPNKTARNLFPKRKVTLFPRNYKEGDVLYKTSDSVQKREIEKLIEADRQRRFGTVFDASVSFEIAKPIKLVYSDGKNTIIEEGDIVEKALNAPISETSLLEKLSKRSQLNSCLNLKIEKYEPGFLQISKINEVRRQFLERLEELEVRYSGKIRMREFKAPDVIKKSKTHKRTWKILAIMSTEEQLNAFISLSDKSVMPCFNPFYRDKGSLKTGDIKRFDKSGSPYYLQLPHIIRKEIKDIELMLSSLNNCKGILTSDYGIIKKYVSDYDIIGAGSLNIYNDCAINILKNVDLFTPSPELTFDEIMEFDNKKSLMPAIHGKIRQMIMEYCPTQDGEPCSCPCQNHKFKLGSSLMKHEKTCRALLFSEKARTNWKFLEEENDTFEHYYFEFTDEDYEETAAILGKYTDKRKL